MGKHSHNTQRALLAVLMGLSCLATGCDFLDDPTGDDVDDGPDAGPPWMGPPPVETDAGPEDDSDEDGVADSDDCEPYDSSAYVQLDLYADADQDGYTVADAISACVDDVHTGYAEQQSAVVDCDDNNAAITGPVLAYVESDGDGVGSGEPQMVCFGMLGLHSYSVTGGDCAPDDPEAYQPYEYQGVDRDGDFSYVPESGTVCGALSMPSGYTEDLPEYPDCDDNDANVNSLEDRYADTDGDGIGAGELQSLCVKFDDPRYVSGAGDCAPDDAKAWQMLTYSYRDADGDGYNVYSPDAVCSGNALPAGYAESSTTSTDCDDNDASRYFGKSIYADTDGDGVGAGDAIALCTTPDAALPPGTSKDFSDCAPDDRTQFVRVAYAGVDRDGDGFTALEKNTLCTDGTLPAPYFAKASGNDCNDADAKLTRWLPLYPDRDGDGIGAWPYQVLCIGDTIPAGFSERGDDDNDHDPKVGANDD